MLSVYSSSNIRAWDAYTIHNEPISSIDLIDRAAMACVEWISRHIAHDKQLHIFCGNGNNGGDGLAMARMLLHAKYEVVTYVSHDTNRSADNIINLGRLKSYSYANIVTIIEGEKIVIDSQNVIVDALFGTGLNKPISGFWKEVIGSINQSNALKISIDIPSGLSADFETNDMSLNIPEADSCVKADYTLTFQVPKPSMMLAGWGNFCGNLQILDIGLSKTFLPEIPCKDFYITQTGIFELFKKRDSFSHKGNYGHALIIAGGKGKCGAAILSASACIKSGAGLVSLLTDETCTNAVYSGTPEIMIEDSEIKVLNFENYTAIGCGPGIGKDAKSIETVKHICYINGIALVLDADAINILAQLNNNFELPPLTILTPHPKEFDRLAGPSKNSFERLKKAKELAVKKNIIVVLKGAHTAICCPNGDTFFNSTGNPGMATAGSGDVLTGMITSFLAQGYTPVNAAIIAVYCHGFAGDLAALQYSKTGLIASDIIGFLNSVFRQLENH
jgi:hydroxyethylthiazole kinase-like uncharacterized protein yjeF